MTHIPDVIAAKAWGSPEPMPRPQDLLRRALFSFALFSTVLFLLLLLSWYLLLPAFTRIELHGVPQDPSRLQTYVQEVKAETRKMEERRTALLLPMDDSPYGALVQEKMSQQSVPSFFEQLKNVARTFLPEQPQAILLQSVSLEGGIMELTGDARNVGLQSMAVLAQFVEAVRAIPGVKRVDFPSFTRERDADIGFHSPFVIRIHFF